MTLAATIWCLVLAVATTAQVAVIFVCLRRFRSYRTAEPTDDRLPRAAVILCLRGSDPFLNDCLEKLTNQDYPDYELWLVLDSPVDPACAIAEHWQNTSPRARVKLTFLAGISVHTSLKCNALVHAIKQLDDSVGAVVLVDADTITYPRWLRNMVAPLVEGDVGVVTGSRWYDPSSRCWGSQLRFIYNGLALVPMYLLDAVWPGSLSIHRRVFSNPNLIRRLLQAPCEDDAILHTLRESGLRLLNTPACIMLNREECGIAGCFDFVRRQLLWTRLSNPAWRWVLAGTVGVFLWLAGGPAILMLTCLDGSPTVALGMAAFMLAILAINVALISSLHRFATRQIARTAGLAPIPISPGARLRLAATLLLLILFYTAAALSASLVRRVRWRGVSYLVRPSRQIEMVRYVPYAREEFYGFPNHSL
jgi:glycosyltransferase involved in cell wall biosynthesis